MVISKNWIAVLPVFFDFSIYFGYDCVSVFFQTRKRVLDRLFDGFLDLFAHLNIVFFVRQSRKDF